MSKPVNRPTVTVRRPRLKSAELYILAKEDKGKITGFEVRYKDEDPVLFKVSNNKVLDAFKRAETYATDKIKNNAKETG